MAHSCPGLLSFMRELLPLFLHLRGRRVVLVGAGPVGASKLGQLLAAGADVRVIAPEVHPDVTAAGVVIERRAFVPSDLDGAWLVVAAATPEVNREVASAAEERRVFVNAVDDPPNATAYLGGVVRRDGVTLAISTQGEAPAVAGLLREALDELLPRDLAAWMATARESRQEWRRDGVPMGERRPLLLKALNRLYEAPSTVVRSVGSSDPTDRRGSMTTRGHVSLVGAGPGDPALLTRKAALTLRRADLVLYDALVDERVVGLARRAQKFYVGKRAGRHALSQHEIEALLVSQVKRGKRIVRLKGGDPFVFGRGGEEAQALERAGISYDVVPGVSSAIAAPASAGIPLTHRDHASAFLVVSGHDQEVFGSAVHALKPNGVTLVILMGLARRAELASQLVEAGWEAATAAAIVSEGTLPTEQTWRGTLGDLATGHGVLITDGPAVIVIGAVAALALNGRAAAEIGTHYDLQRTGTRPAGTWAGRVRED